MAPQDRPVANQPPSPWYFLTLALGCAGMTFLFMAVWSAWQVQAQRNPADNIGNIGAIGLALGFAVLFADRAVRWEQLGASLRALVAGAITALLWLTVVGAAYAVYLAFVATEARSGTVNALTAFTCLCTIGTVIWLVRLRPGWRPG